MNTAVKQCTTGGCTELRVVSRGHETKCREHKNEQARNWVAANPEKVKAANTRNFAKREGKVYLDKFDGYMKRLGIEHPASNPSGITRFHRIVLWEKLNGQNAPCAECGGMLRWDVPSNHPDYMVGDHIDEDKLNNHADNIDPVHLACNTKRAQHNAAKRKAAALTEESAQ